MIETWKTFVNVCEAHRIAPEIVIRPKMYQEHRQASARAIVVREMAKQGVSVKNLRSVCPMDESLLYKLIKDSGSRTNS